MKRIFSCSFLFIALLCTTACKKDWLDRTPRTIILENQVWNDPVQITGLLANYYDRLVTDMGLDVNNAQWRNMANYDDAMWSGQSNEDGRNNIANYGADSWRLWNYDLIRDINLALEGIVAYGTSLTAAQKTQFDAEFRFIRAANYFELVKRMGGVPLVTKQLIYDYSGNPTPLQVARAKESEVYDFIASEMDAIKNNLGNDGSNTRANRYTAMALKSRAMLYAASIAKYNSALPSPITTAGGEVGIPASMAAAYYQKSLDASKEVIASGKYSLYQSNPSKGDNFYEATTKKNNVEMIFAKAYLSPNKRHVFSYDNIALGLREDNLSSSSVTPSLNLVESFDYLDGTAGALKTRTADNSDYIYYTNVEDIFANKDGRMAGTLMYPGSSFKGIGIQEQAGVMVWNASSNSYTTIEGASLGTIWGGTNYPAGDGKLLTGTSGPHRSIQEVSNTGFYMKKFIDAGAGTSTRGIQSDVWWVWFRLGEIYLNATEAAFELGQTADALTYINTLRQRAGFPANSLTAATLNTNKIRNEFRVELAFEDHRLWDLKRWRIADKVWSGSTSNPDDMVYALYPYRVVRPGDAARDGKYVYVKMVAPRFRAPRFFQIFNYYSSIDQVVLNNNPKIVRNPFQ